MVLIGSDLVFIFTVGPPPRRLQMQRNFFSFALSCILLAFVTALPLPPFTISTVVGTGDCLFSGDGGSALAAELCSPSYVLLKQGGNLFIADTASNRLRLVNASTGVITTFAGTGTGELGSNPTNLGDNGPATNAELNSPVSLVQDGKGNLFVSEQLGNRVRRIASSNNVITTVVGTGQPGYSGDNGPATLALLNQPWGLSLGPSGVLYVAEKMNCVVRAVAMSGVVTTAAGVGSRGFSGDGGAASNAALGYPTGIVVAGGVLYICDSWNNRVRSVLLSTGTITTVAGSTGAGAGGYSGDGGLASLAVFNNPTGIAVDGAGNVLIADSANNVLRSVNLLSGIVSTVAGNHIGGYNGDTMLAINASLNNPVGVFAYGSDMWVADTFNNRVRKLEASLSPTNSSIPAITSSSRGFDNGMIFVIIAIGLPMVSCCFCIIQKRVFGKTLEQTQRASDKQRTFDLVATTCCMFISLKKQKIKIQNEPVVAVAVVANPIRKDCA